MSARSLQRPGLLLVALVAALLGLLLLAGGAYVYDKHRQARERLEQLEPRHARLLGLLQSQEQLAAAARRQAALVGAYTHGPEQDASQVGNGALQQLRNLLTQAGCQVLSSQVLPARDDLPEFDRIPITLSIEADPQALHNALAAIESSQPAMLVTSLNLQVNTLRRAGEVPPLSAALSVSVLRRRS
ncbi:type II secretion system protein GspM [Ottowia sp.]|jgi:general secretion pathway protein M|uniref:type II secretion system protein GspM n=1 Tax=Ottowia sp. TaxID=1898956 RepID=UPI002BF5F1ED|nr:type II secretion system protein GspM [Ottowia sp.]HRN75291.1 type II secretion system protein GspM [Ottowia sp.]HRQ02489.1 type II secretion system protein GspM [Ottowia sp.]